MENGKTLSSLFSRCIDPIFPVSFMVNKLKTGMTKVATKTIIKINHSL